MKKIVFSIAAFLAAEGLFAQIKEGLIVYERKVNMHRRITDEQMKAMMPEFRISNYQLLFSDSTSLYKAVPEENAPDPFASPTGGGGMVFRMGADGSEQFRNFSQAKLIESRDLGAKTYIIEDSIKQQPWKLTDETKTILNYTCKKAVMQTERGQNVEAWYTESIPCPAGPESFANLPGVILQLDVNKGEVVYTATNVSATVAKNEIQAPKKGKKITRQEYSKMMQDMIGAQPGGGRIIMRMN
jgi:GLPGLI family protein